MKSKYLVSLLTIVAGLSLSTQAAMADVVVKWKSGDNAANIQKAIDSGDKTIIIPKAAKPWIIGQKIFAKQPNQKIIFKSGVVLEAKKGAFKGTTDNMITVLADNVTLSGYGATIKMRKSDYQNSNLYQPSQFRHIIVLKGARNVTVEGLSLENSGGDGIIVAHGLSEGNKAPAKKFSSGVIRDVVAKNNHRQGLTITSAKDLLVQNSTFEGTSGTKPSAGIDIEPDYDWQKLSNIRLKNNKFLNNQRNGIQVGLLRYRGSNVSDISITFDGCTSRGNKEDGISINAHDPKFTDGPKGFITIKNCKIANSGQHGISVKSDHKNPSKTFDLNFENITLNNTATTSGNYYPVSLLNTNTPGVSCNIDFGKNFSITDNKKRPGLWVSNPAKNEGLTNIHGVVKVNNSNKLETDLGNKLTNVSLKVN